VGITMTGNAYAVTIGAEDARLEHLHDQDQPVSVVPIAVFRDAARAWAGFLRAQPSAATPGSDLPSSHSRNAPPAVET
jgi:hypothetical protein